MPLPTLAAPDDLRVAPAALGPRRRADPAPAVRRWRSGGGGPTPCASPTWRCCARCVGRRPGLRRHLPPLLFLLGIGALLFSLARPSAVIAIPREQADVMLVVDTSGSMTATDLKPSRIVAARQAAEKFVQALPPNTRVGSGRVLLARQARLAVDQRPGRRAERDSESRRRWRHGHRRWAGAGRRRAPARRHRGVGHDARGGPAGAGRRARHGRPALGRRIVGRPAAAAGRTRAPTRPGDGPHGRHRRAQLGRPRREPRPRPSLTSGRSSRSPPRPAASTSTRPSPATWSGSTPASARA